MPAITQESGTIAQANELAALYGTPQNQGGIGVEEYMRGLERIEQRGNCTTLGLLAAEILLRGVIERDGTPVLQLDDFRERLQPFADLQPGTLVGVISTAYAHYATFAPELAEQYRTQGASVYTTRSTQYPKGERGLVTRGVYYEHGHELGMMLEPGEWGIPVHLPVAYKSGDTHIHLLTVAVNEHGESRVVLAPSLRDNCIKIGALSIAAASAAQLTQEAHENTLVNLAAA